MCTESKYVLPETTIRKTSSTSGRFEVIRGNMKKKSKKQNKNIRQPGQ